MKGIYIGNHRMLVTPIWGGKLIVSSDDRSLMPELVVNGIFEIPLTKYLIKHLKHGDMVIDIGGNIGYFTVLIGYLVGKEGKVIVYEPDPENYLLLQENVSINYMSNRIIVKNKAVYSENGTITFYVTGKYKGNGSINKPDTNYFEMFGIDNIVEKKVEAENLDDTFKDFNVIDLVKIDIEGGEYHALLGMKNLIETGKIQTIIFELNKLRLGNDIRPLFNLLESWSERHYFFVLTDDGDESIVNVDEIFNQDFIAAVGMRKIY